MDENESHNEDTFSNLLIDENKVEIDQTLVGESREKNRMSNVSDLESSDSKSKYTDGISPTENVTNHTNDSVVDSNITHSNSLSSDEENTSNISEIISEFDFGSEKECVHSEERDTFSIDVREMMDAAYKELLDEEGLNESRVTDTKNEGSSDYYGEVDEHTKRKKQEELSDIVESDEANEIRLLSSTQSSYDEIDELSNRQPYSSIEKGEICETLSVFEFEEDSKIDEYEKETVQFTNENMSQRQTNISGKDEIRKEKTIETVPYVENEEETVGDKSGKEEDENDKESEKNKVEPEAHFQAVYQPEYFMNVDFDEASDMGYSSPSRNSSPVAEDGTGDMRVYFLYKM